MPEEKPLAPLQHAGIFAPGSQSGADHGDAERSANLRIQSSRQLTEVFAFGPLLSSRGPARAEPDSARIHLRRAT